MRFHSACAVALGLATLLPQCQAHTSDPPSTPASASAVASKMAAEPTPEQEAAKPPQSCTDIEGARDRAYCYLKTDREDSIDPLFDLAHHSNELQYAAENAGILAAKTQEARLYAHFDGGDETDQLFALKALSHMIAYLRFGHAHGHQVDDDLRAKRIERVRSTCKSKIQSPSAEVMKTVISCLEEIHNPDDVPVLVDVAVHQTRPEIQKQAAGVLEKFAPVPADSLRVLAAALEVPLAARWSHDELYFRGSICRILLRDVPASETWPKKSADIAAKAMDKKNGQQRAPCQQLVDR